MSCNTAYLSNEHDVIRFSFHDKVIRFRGPYSIESIINVKKWDRGYLVVDVKYSHSKEPLEDYIDLIPILELLYIDGEEFVSEIDKVEVKYAG